MASLKLGPDTLAVTNAKLPFKEQIDFFKSKAGLQVPTEHFDDVEPSFHRRGWMVAGAQKAGLLSDLYDAMAEVIEEGQSIDWFRKRFDAIVQTHGWEHRGAPGIRAATIYDTNMSTSYARGRDIQLADPELRAARPYLEYKIGQAENHRPIHVSWNGLTLRYDDPWWDSHRPVKAWRCHCWVRAVAEPTPGKSAAPPESTYEYTDRHGEIHTLPVGVDYGFETGKGWAPDPKNYPPPIAKALEKELAKVPAKPAGWVPAKTTKEAEQWARDADIADAVDYKGIHVDVANAWNQSIWEHLQEFPELRPNFKFIGTAQARNDLWHREAVEDYVQRLKSVNPATADESLRDFAKKQIKKPKNAGNVFASAANEKWGKAQGIAVNAKWGKDPEAFRAALARSVAIGFHPVGCDSIRSVVDHEIGHQLDYLLSLRTSAEIKAAADEAATMGGIAANLSGYAATNTAEFIAEGWAETLNNPTPRPTAARIGAIIREKYRRQHG